MTTTKATAKLALGLTSDESLAEILERTRQAVHLWPDDQELAAPYRWMLHGKYPGKFPKPRSRK